MERRVNGWAIVRVVGHRPVRTGAGRAVEVLDCGHDGQVVGRLGKYSGRAWDSPTHRTCTACMVTTFPPPFPKAVKP